MRRTLAHAPAVTSREGTYDYSNQLIMEMHNKILETVRKAKDERRLDWICRPGLRLSFYVVPIMKSVFEVRKNGNEM